MNEEKVNNAWHRIIKAKSITKKEFNAFVNLLAEDALSGAPIYWEDNISDYLTDLASAIRAIEGLYQNNNVEIPVEPSWKSFALALHTAAMKNQTSIPISKDTEVILQAEIRDTLDKIATKEDFVAFIELLAEDATNNPTKWENSNKYFYLEALGRWTESIEGWFEHQNIEAPTEPTWQMFGQILSAAAIYE